MLPLGKIYEITPLTLNFKIMNLKRNLLLSIAIFFAISAFSKMIFSYDKTGNCISGLIDMSVPQFKESRSMQDSIMSELERGCIKIFPNPTKGILKVHIGLSGKYSSVMKIYSLDGIEYNKVSDVSEYVFDMTSYPDGIYVLVIEIDKVMKTWKIIKES